MKLIRHGAPGREKPGLILPDGRKIDTSEFGEDYDPPFFGSGGTKRLAQWIDTHEASASEIGEDERMASPVANPGKMICIGLNYEDHAEEGGQAIPNEPILFFKATSSIVGPNDDLVLPKDGHKADWEVELAVIIGKTASYVSEDKALDHVAGYCLHNDYSERAFQFERAGQWVKGKSCDSFAPLGPFVATKSEIDDVNDLKLWLNVNGEAMQQGHTSDMIFSVSYLVSYISQFMRLLPGDIISTGTPAGVGHGMDPPKYLQLGDRVELGIDQLGSSCQNVKAFSP
jgi:2-keto-4-pentenoate hydratase/2-oxohepta-3-ene-1,7-dioic acid hydratase in catechol pathway